MKRLRGVLILTLVAITLIAACQPQTVVVKETVEVEKVVTEIVKETVKETVVVAPTATPEPTAAPVELESPMLAAKVAAGELPPLEERLPASPLVVRADSLAYKGAIPDFALGNYGGQLKIPLFPAGGLDVYTLFGAREPLVRGPDISLEGGYANVLADFQISPDNTEFTFTLRQGLKWSDGVPVTMEDVQFVVEDLWFNEDYSPTVPWWLTSPDEASTPMVFTVLDDWTFKMTYTAPFGSLIKYLALQGWNGYDPLLRPKHAMEQYHPKYAEAAALKSALEKDGLEADQWPTLFNQNYCNHWDMSFMRDKCIGFPVLSPWIMTEVTIEAGSFERNPYYWKVDEAGRQLPYIDEVVVVTLPDPAAAQVVALNGDVDVLYSVDLIKAALFMEKGNTLGYELIMGLGSHADGLVFYFDGCTVDPVVRELFNNIRFREAMNYAMNRQEINDALYLGFAESPDNIQPSDYDPEKANEILDEIGMTERDADGFRLSPDGQPVKIFAEGRAGGGLRGMAQGGELFAEHLKAVGINAEMRQTDVAVFAERAAQHEIQIAIWESYIGATDIDGLFTNAPGTVWCSDWNWLESSGDPKPEDIPDEFVAYVQAIEDRKAFMPRSPEDAKRFQIIADFYRDTYWALVSATKQPVPCWISKEIGNDVISGTAVGMLDALAIWYFK